MTAGKHPVTGVPIDAEGRAVMTLMGEEKSGRSWHSSKVPPCECVMYCSQGTGGCRLDGTEHVHPDLGECQLHPDAPRSEG